MKGAASLPDGSNPEGLDCSPFASQGGVGTSLTWNSGDLGSAPSILHDPGRIPAACCGGALVQMLSVSCASFYPLPPAPGCSSHTAPHGTTSIPS